MVDHLGKCAGGCSATIVFFPVLSFPSISKTRVFKRARASMITQCVDRWDIECVRFKSHHELDIVLTQAPAYPPEQSVNATPPRLTGFT